MIKLALVYSPRPYSDLVTAPSKVEAIDEHMTLLSVFHHLLSRAGFNSLCFSLSSH